VPRQKPSLQKRIARAVQRFAERQYRRGKSVLKRRAGSILAVLATAGAARLAAGPYGQRVRQYLTTGFERVATKLSSKRPQVAGDVLETLTGEREPDRAASVVEKGVRSAQDWLSGGKLEVFERKQAQALKEAAQYLMEEAKAKGQRPNLQRIAQQLGADPAHLERLLYPLSDAEQKRMRQLADLDERWRKIAPWLTRRYERLGFPKDRITELMLRHKNRFFGGSTPFKDLD